MLRVTEIRDLDDDHRLTRDEFRTCGQVTVIGQRGICLYLQLDGSLGVAVATLEEVTNNS